VFLVIGGFFWYLAPKIWIAREASRTLAEERADGTLEMILSTPISVNEIIRGQWVALRKCYLIAIIFSLIVHATLFVVVNFVPAATGLYGVPYANSVIISAMIMLLFDCVTVGWVGMWQGLKIGDAKTAARTTASRVISYPMLVFGLCFLLAAILLQSNNFPTRSPYIPIALWLIVGVAFDIVLIKTSRALLYREFRNIVQEPALARDAWARGLGRWLGKKFRRK